MGSRSLVFRDQEGFSFRELMELLLLVVQQRGQLTDSEIIEIDFGTVVEAVGAWFVGFARCYHVWNKYARSKLSC